MYIFYALLLYNVYVKKQIHISQKQLLNSVSLLLHKKIQINLTIHLFSKINTPFPIYLSDNVFLDCKHAVGMMGTVVAVICLSLSNCLDQI